MGNEESTQSVNGWGLPEIRQNPPSAQIVDMPRSPAGKPLRRRDPIGTFARGVGQTLISLGAVVLLFVVYEVYVTDLLGAQKQADAITALEQLWVEAPPVVAAQSGAVTTVTAVVAVPGQLPVEEQVADPQTREVQYDIKLGAAFSKIFIPSFGPDFSYAIIEGTEPDDLYAGPGHYVNSQLPGGLGNFAVAGHRVSKGSPFNDLHKLNSCDALVIETRHDWFVYRVLPLEGETAAWNPRSRPACADVEVPEGTYANILGREITVPNDIAQVHAVPHDAANDVSAATARMITLTTCHPQFSDAERMIIHGVLVKSYSKTAGFLPPELFEVN